MWRGLSARRSFLRRLAWLGWAGAVATGGPGCSEPCTQIQELICACQYRTRDERTRCEDAAAAQASLQSPTSADQDQCAALVPACEAALAGASVATPSSAGTCSALESVEARQACGLALVP